MAVLCCCAAFAQNASTAQKSQVPSDQPVPKFQSGVDLVLVPVVVRNKQGQAVGGLTKDDFEIFDSGKRQEIASFSAIIQPNTSTDSKIAPSLPEAPVNGITSAEANRPKAVARVGANASSQRFVIYLFDDLAIGVTDIIHVRSALIRHLRGLADNDNAAIYTFSGRPETDFTNDRQKLEDAAAKLRSSFESAISDDAKACPNISYYLADLIVNHGDQRAREAAVSHTRACDTRGFVDCRRSRIERCTAAACIRFAAEQNGVENAEAGDWPISRQAR